MTEFNEDSLHAFPVHSWPFMQTSNLCSLGGTTDLDWWRYTAVTTNATVLIRYALPGGASSIIIELYAASFT